MDQLQDWLFRYQYIYSTRHSKRQKQRFLAALVNDIAAVRQDVQVIEYQRNQKYAASQLYVGNIETAEQIICTYYDTPPKGFGPHYLFDRKKQTASATQYVLLSSLLMLLLGGILTLVYIRQAPNSFQFNSLMTWLVMLGYGSYFYLFSKVTKGLANRKNLVRNTSSIVTLLSLLTKNQDSKTAFAFLDEGSYGEAGLAVLQGSCQATAKIYFIDCIGADEEIHVIGKVPKSHQHQKLRLHPPISQQVTYIFSSKTKETPQGTEYYLEREKLHQKQLKLENIKTVVALFHQEEDKECLEL